MVGPFSERAVEAHLQTFPRHELAHESHRVVRIQTCVRRRRCRVLIADPLTSPILVATSSVFADADTKSGTTLAFAFAVASLSSSKSSIAECSLGAPRRIATLLDLGFKFEY